MDKTDAWLRDPGTMIHGLPESVLRKGTMTAQAETGATKKNRRTLGMFTERIYVKEEDLGGATNLLEDEGIDFDLDSCDRIMCDEDDVGTILNLLEENGIDADLI